MALFAHAQVRGQTTVADYRVVSVVMTLLSLLRLLYCCAILLRHRVVCFYSLLRSRTSNVQAHGVYMFRSAPMACQYTADYQHGMHSPPVSIQRKDPLHFSQLPSKLGLSHKTNKLLRHVRNTRQQMLKDGVKPPYNLSKSHANTLKISLTQQA